MIKNCWCILFLLTSVLAAQNSQEQTPDITVDDIKRQLQTKDLPTTTRIDNLLILGYENINKSKDVWWFNIRKDKFNKDVHLLLNSENKVIWIKLKKGFIINCFLSKQI